MSSNYNARLDPREDFDAVARRARMPAPKTRSRAEGRGLRSSIVRPARWGREEEREEDNVDDDGFGLEMPGGW